jgi:hypothetical protein
MPSDIPKVEEIGATSAPLLSASYFIGDRCKAFNDDFMKCKAEANGRGEMDCLKEGRKVTRCAASVYVFSCRFLTVLAFRFYAGCAIVGPRLIEAYCGTGSRTSTPTA